MEGTGRRGFGPSTDYITEIDRSCIHGADGRPAGAWPRSGDTVGLGQIVLLLLFADHLDHDFPRAGMVQFDEEDALVGPELHLAINHRHGLAGSQEQVL